MGPEKGIDCCAEKTYHEDMVFQKGEILRHLERAEEALEAYSRAIQLDPKFVRAYTARGKVLSGLERYEEALEMSEKALKLDPKSASAYFLREKALRALGKEEEAKATQERGFDLLLSALQSHIGKANAQYERKQQKRRTAH